MNILIISGFLGSGKTTFISELVKRTNSKLAIMENEYGALDVDGSLLKKNSDVYDFSDGCICCSMKSDFTMSVLTIANSVNLDYLIIEPTGVGLLGNVLNSLKKIEYDRIQILNPITIVDALNFDDQISEYRELMENQIKYASRVILSKIESMNSTDIDNIIKKIKKINPNCIVDDRHYLKFDDSFWKNILRDKYSSESKLEDVSTPNLDTISYENIAFNTKVDLSSVIGAIMQGRFGTITRLKGYVKVSNEILKLDIVGKEFKFEKIEISDTPRLVIIGKDLNKDKLNILFDFYKIK